jgi:hypothetical protein
LIYKPPEHRDGSWGRCSRGPFRRIGDQSRISEAESQRRPGRPIACAYSGPGRDHGALGHARSRCSAAQSGPEVRSTTYYRWDDRKHDPLRRSEISLTTSQDWNTNSAEGVEMLIAARLQRRARRPLAGPELPSVSFPKTSASLSLVPICRGAHLGCSTDCDGRRLSQYPS